MNQVEVEGTNLVYKFVSVGPNGSDREVRSVREAFELPNTRGVFIILRETGSRFQVIRP
jgi:hypothetical protein